MDSSKIALFTEYFNILAVIAAAFFAVYGGVAVVFKNHRLNIFRGRAFAQAFCVAALIALAAEFTFFNYEYYSHYFYDDDGFQVTGVSPEDSMLILTSDPAVTAKVRIDSSTVARFPGPTSYIGNAPVEVKYDTVWTASGITFSGLNRRIGSIYVEPAFGNDEHIDIYIHFIDKQGIGGAWRRLLKGFPRDNHIPLQVCGEVSEFSIVRPGHDLLGSVTAIEINKQIPYYFSGIRLFAASFLFFAVIIFAHKKLRVRIADLLFRRKFDPASGRQNRAYALMVGLLLLYAFICAFTSTDKFWREEYLGDRQYNMFLVDALLNGRAYLDVGRPEMLQVAERPYDLDWLRRNGYSDAAGWWYGDWAYYEGKFYSYFGVVPAVLLFVPYKMITGDYLPNYAGIFVFMAAAIVLMAALWRHVAKKYLSGAPFAFYMLSFITLFFASGLFVPLRFTRFYSIVSSAGFMFVVAGIFLLLKSVDGRAAGKSVDKEKPCRVRLFFACLCFALAVGCRPNLVLASLIVPVVLWRYRSFRTAVIAAIPYILVAIPLCYYNYIRFGSITDFGVKFNMTNMNVGATSQLALSSKLRDAFTAAAHYLFSINSYSLFYPYVETVNQLQRLDIISRRFFDKGPGIINFPIVFCLFFYFRALIAKLFARRQTPSLLTDKQPFVLSSAFLAIAFATIFLNSWLIGHSGRYITDFAFFIVLPSILYAYQWCRGGVSGVGAGGDVRRLKVTYSLFAASVFVGLCLFAGNVSNDPSPGDPVLYRYLQYSLGVLR